MSNPFGPNKDQLRKELDPRTVAAYLVNDGAPGPYIQADGTAICPFHNDTDPSFYLWDGDDGIERWWCQPCAFGGDIFDLIMRLKGLTFPESIKYAERIRDSLPPNYKPPVHEAKNQKFQVPLSERAHIIESARARAASEKYDGYMATGAGFVSLLDGIEHAKEWDEHLRWWGWGVSEEGAIMCPHWDKDGNLVGCKIRKPGQRKDSLPGSTYGVLYGSWRGRRVQHVLITEGETDAVYASWLAQKEGIPLDVFGLPSGVGKPPTAEMAAFLGNPTILYLAFDPDPPGVAGTWKWIDDLLRIGIGNIRVCRLPFGNDLRETRPKLRTLLDNAMSPLIPPDQIQEVGGITPGYAKQDGQGGWVAITAWIAEPFAILRGNDGVGYEIILHARHTREKTVIWLADLASPQTLNKWANQHGLTFTGSDTDRKLITKYIEAKGSIVPEIFQTAQVGAHDPPEEYDFAGATVVYSNPDEYLGKMPFTYAPTLRYKNVSGQLLLPYKDNLFHWWMLEEFLKLSEPSVMHPLLAWLVASSRRHEVRDFPLLFIAGSSGVGKSTLAHMGMKLMGSGIETDLGSVTPFILVKTLACSTNIPVFVDEWTRLSRPDTREAFQSNIPTLYMGGDSERGQADLSTTTYRMQSPVIVAGEDTFKLTRERDRTVVIYPTKGAQNPDALVNVEAVPLQGFAQTLHHFLFATPRRTSLVRLDYAHTTTRPEYNQIVLLAGWRTLQDMIAYHAANGDATIPDIPTEPDLSCFLIQEEEENTYDEAVKAALPLKDSSGNRVAWTDDEGKGTWIRAEAILTAVERNTDIRVPGSKTAMLNFFRERYGRDGVVYDRHAKPPGASRQLGGSLIVGLHLQDPEHPFDAYDGGG